MNRNYSFDIFFLLNFFTKLSKSIFNVLSLISENTGLKLFNKIVLAVDTNEIGDVITLFFLSLGRHISAKCKPAVQLLTATAYFEPTYFAMFFQILLLPDHESR